jgi:hypothetical protein
MNTTTFVPDTLGEAIGVYGPDAVVSYAHAVRILAARGHTPEAAAAALDRLGADDDGAPVHTVAEAAEALEAFDGYYPHGVPAPVARHTVLRVLTTAWWVATHVYPTTAEAHPLGVSDEAPWLVAKVDPDGAARFSVGDAYARGTRLRSSVLEREVPAGTPRLGDYRGAAVAAVADLLGAVRAHEADWARAWDATAAAAARARDDDGGYR